MKNHLSSVIYHLLLAVAPCLLFSGCERPALYSYQSVAADGWWCTDTLRFETDNLTAHKTYVLRAGVRCNNSYAFQNLWLVVERRVPSEENHRDTLQLLLTDDRTLDFSSGSIVHEKEQTIGTFRVRQSQQPIELLVYHVMEEQLLKGVEEVGVQVTLSGE